MPVQVSAFLTNNGSTAQTLIAGTPCDVHTWVLRDSSGNLIQREPEELCIQVIATRTINPGETIREDTTVALDGRLLQDGHSYVLNYGFWGIASQASFVVRVAQ